MAIYMTWRLLMYMYFLGGGASLKLWQRWQELHLLTQMNFIEKPFLVFKRNIAIFLGHIFQCLLERMQLAFGEQLFWGLIPNIVAL